NGHHPDGLANRSGVVGRHYMGHVNSVLMAVSKCPNPTIFQKSLSLNDFYFGDSEFPYPMGHISFVGKLDGVTLKGGAPAIAPGFTLDLMARHSLDFWLTSEDLPDPENRVTLDSQGRIVLDYRPNNEEAHRQLIARLKAAMKAQRACSLHGKECHEGLFARSLYVGQRIPLAGVAHQNGTIRFGNDPRTSALDRDCKAHDLDNLYVVDASFFPSSAARGAPSTYASSASSAGPLPVSGRKTFRRTCARGCSRHSAIGRRPPNDRVRVSRPRLPRALHRHRLTGSFARSARDGSAGTPPELCDLLPMDGGRARPDRACRPDP